MLFWTKVFCAAFLFLQFDLVIFWRKNFGTKAAHKMLIELITEVTEVNFTNILRANFTNKSALRSFSFFGFLIFDTRNLMQKLLVKF